jgi:putative membrane protein
MPARRALAASPVGERAPDPEEAMRYVYIGLIVVFTAVVLLFKFQNLQTATVSLFSASITLPVSILVIGIYILGMLTGGSLVALLRTWIGGARRTD